MLLAGFMLNVATIKSLSRGMSKPGASWVKVTQIETYPTRLTILNVEPGIIVSTDYTAYLQKVFHGKSLDR